MTRMRPLEDNHLRSRDYFAIILLVYYNGSEVHYIVTGVHAAE